MKRFLILLIFLPLFGYSQIKVSEMTPATSVNDADKFLIVQSGSSKSVAYSVFKNDASDVGAQINDTAQVLRNNVIWGTDANNTSFGISLGYQAGKDIESGGLFNSFLGYQAGSSLTTGNSNTFLGYKAGEDQTTGGLNTFIGNNAGANVISTSNITYLGYGAGQYATGQRNTAIGSQSYSVAGTTGEENTLVGYRAGQVWVVQNYGVSIGALSGTTTSTTGNYNTLLGYNSQLGAENLDNSTAIGANATVLTDSTIVLGDSTDTKITRDLYVAGNINSSYLTTNFASQSSLNDTASAIRGDIPSVSFGTEGQIPYTNIAGDGWNYSSSFIWDGTALAIEAGSGNTFIGKTSGNTITTGVNNTFLGYNTGYSIGSYNRNVFIGHNSGYLTTANQNSFLGANSGDSNTTGSDNAFFGFDSGQGNQTGNNNTYLGARAGSQNTGSNNVAVGKDAGFSSSSGSGNIFLGYEAGENETGSNKLYIENSNSTTPLIYGEFDNNKLRFNADTSTFVGHVKIDSNLYVNGRLLSQKYEAFAYLDPDSTITTSATTDWTFLGDGSPNKFINLYMEGFSTDGDTVYFVQDVNDVRDSIEFRFSATASTASSVVNKTVFYGVFIKSVGETAYSEVRQITAKTRTATADVYYAGPTATTTPVFLKDGDKIQIKVKVAASTATLSTEDAKIYLREE